MKERVTYQNVTDEGFGGIPVVNSEKAYMLWEAEKVIFLDNRVKTKFESEKIGGARWLLAEELLKNPTMAEALDRDSEYVVYCDGVHSWRSPAAALMLWRLGFRKIFRYRDGIADWKKRGYPTERAGTEAASALKRWQDEY